MCRRYLTFFVTLFLLVSSLHAQLLSGHSTSIKGQLLNDSTNQVIPFAHLFNESKRVGSISNTNGSFSLIASPGDTLIFSALGYFSKIVFVSDSLLSHRCNITLKTTRFIIEEVSILAFRDYEHFKKAFLNLELPQTKTKMLRNSLAELSIKEALEGEKEIDMRINELQPNIRLVKGNVILQSQDDITRMYTKKILEKASRQRAIQKKYNREILQEITKLKEDELSDFMWFCDFSEEFLFHATPYEIAVKVEEKLIAYKLSKGSGELQKSNMEDLGEFHS